MRPLYQRLRCQVFLTGTDARPSVPTKGYTSNGLHVSPPEEIGKRQGGNEISPRRAEIKLRKKQMKLRRNEIISPKSFPAPHWIIRDPYQRICDFLHRDCCIKATRCVAFGIRLRLHTDVCSLQTSPSAPCASSFLQSQDNLSSKIVSLLTFATVSHREVEFTIYNKVSVLLSNL